jgi:hypothetical protein
MRRFVLLPLALATIGTVPAQGRQAKKDAPPERPSLLAIVPNSATRGDTLTARVTGKFLGKIDHWDLSGGDGATVVASETAADGASATLTIRFDPTARPSLREVRGSGRYGPTNPLSLAIDDLPTVAEIEPNDRPDQAQAVPIGRAVAAVLGPTDRDVYAVEAPAGTVLSISCLARRLGVPIQPQIAVSRGDGRFVARFLGSTGADGDLQFALPISEPGRYLLEFRDTVYHGNALAGYRLRVEGAGRFATGMAPLAVATGGTARFELAGGALARPLVREQAVPDRSGVLRLGPFDGPDGPIAAPMKVLAVPSSALRVEPLKVGESVEPSTAPVVIAGRLDQEGEVDRFAVTLRKGQPVAVRVRAAELGSWLDAVLAVTEPSDPTRVLAENDDQLVPGGRPQGNGPAPYVVSPSDSRLRFDPPRDGLFTVEIADRFGRGGPEYGYVLELGLSVPGLQATLLQLPGAAPAVTIKPGQEVTVNVQVAATGDVGVVRLRAIDLPQGLSSAPIEVKPGASPTTGRNAGGPSYASGGLKLKADDDAVPVSGSIRIVAEAAQPPGGGGALSCEALWAGTLATLPAHPSDRPIESARGALPVSVVPPFEPSP